MLQNVTECHAYEFPKNRLKKKDFLPNSSERYLQISGLPHNCLPIYLAQNQAPTNATTSSFPAQTENNVQGSTKPPTKQPYGSGDTDDGYTLVFANLEAFHEWRNQEEERQMVEFVKGDTHGSKAVPPRFKDHTKLVCARHSRSGRKKYVKKHPERVRKVPSRKLEGVGCPASISFKTYFDTDEVRACYISQHSHEIGLANLPFTRRGRKAAAQREKDKTRRDVLSVDPANPAPTSTSANPVAGANNNGVAGPSSASQPNSMFGSAVSMLAPLPGQAPYPHPSTQAYGYPSVPQPFSPLSVHPALSHDRWENMATLFHSIREHARGFEYPTVSVAALETVLIRLYLESPVNLGSQPTIMQGGAVQPRPPPAPAQGQPVQGVQQPGSADSGVPGDSDGAVMEEGS